ncbi:MAG: dynamin family protein [Candidatus Hydrogenedentes bacterium]|nr:dynamin family protein [Candidatus Hydrogenedentota bacterium]
MGIKEHQESRRWAFEALDSLNKFTDDPEFEGELETIKNQIYAKKNELRDGKYRVVFLGEFNVGKTTLINAFLTDTYLPMVLEECTAKVTHVLKGNSMQLILRSQKPIHPEKIQVLKEFLNYAGIEANIEPDSSHNYWVIKYQHNYPEDLNRTLNAIVTLSADEEFPKLKALREEVEEVIVLVPEAGIEEDVAFVDSPGVHSITETHRKITEDIIPNCHLVVCLLDSQNAGNEHNRDFIIKLVKERQRKVFFVINKCDQLNPDEIDPEFRRGPAKDLFRCIDGIVENPEIFFVSALYALSANQLRKGSITIQDLDKNEKIHIPYTLRLQIENSSNPAEAIADYLIQRSKFYEFKERLFDYLYHENREGAVLSSVSRFIKDTALKFAKPIEVKIKLAQQNPKLERLKKERKRLQDLIDEYSRFLNDLLDKLNKITGGGEVAGEKYDSYDSIIEKCFSRQAIENEIFKPIREWLCTGDNLKIARKNKYLPLQEQFGITLDKFLQKVDAEINSILEKNESYIIREINSRGFNFSFKDLPKVSLTRGAIVAIDASLALSYFLFFIIGGILGGLTGAIIGEGFLSSFSWADFLNMAVPDYSHLSAVILGILGSISGAIIGISSRALGGDEIRREKLLEKISAYIEEILIKGLKENLKETLQRHKEEVALQIKKHFDEININLHQQIQKILAEEEHLEQIQKETITRLETKLNSLLNIANKATEIMESTFRIPS